VSTNTQGRGGGDLGQKNWGETKKINCKPISLAAPLSQPTKGSRSPSPPPLYGLLSSPQYPATTPPQLAAIPLLWLAPKTRAAHKPFLPSSPNRLPPHNRPLCHFGTSHLYRSNHGRRSNQIFPLLSFQPLSATPSSSSIFPDPSFTDPLHRQPQQRRPH